MDNKIPHILIVDDDANLLATMSDILKMKGFEPVSAQTGAAALAQLEKHRFDLALIDLRLDDMSGLLLLRAIKTHSPETECILLTGHASQDTAIEAIQMGVYGYFQKPFEMEQVLLSIQRAVEKSAAEKALRASEAQYRLLAENMSDTIWLMDMNLKTVYISPSVVRLRGYTLEEINSVPLDQQMTPESLQRAMLLFANALSAENLGQPNPRITYSIELEFLNKDGSKVWSDNTFTLILDPNGQPTNILGSGRDITARKQAEDAQQESEREFRTLFELSPDAVMLIDPYDPNISWPIVDCNAAACQMNGYNREELIGQSIDIVNTAPGSKPERDAYLERLQKAGTLNLETYHRHKNGAIFPIEVSTSIIKVGGRELLIGIDRDITERKRAEDELRQSEERFQLASWATKDLIWERNFSANTISWNDNLKKLFHYTSNEVESTIDWWQGHIHPADRDKVIKSIQTAIEQGGDFWSKEYRFWVDDCYVNIFDRGYILYNEQGKPVRMIGAMADITERKQAESKLRESEERYRTIFDGVQDAIFVETKDGRILEVNNSACEMYGYKRDDFLTKTVSDFVLEGSVVFAPHLNSSAPLETFNRRANGELFPIEISGGIQTINGEEVVLAIVRDVTEHKKAEAALRESEQKYRLLFDEMMSGVAVHEIICDEQGKPIDYRFIAINSAFEKMTGLVSAAVVGRTVMEVLPATESYWIERYGQVALTRIPTQFENYSSELGKYFEVRAFSPEKGKFATIFNDITERKHAEKEVEFRLSFETALTNIQADFLAVTDDKMDDAIIHAQRQLCEFLGTDRSALWQGSIEEPQVLYMTHLCTLDEIPPVPDRVTTNNLFPWFTKRLIAGEVVAIHSVLDLPPAAVVDRENLLYYGDKSTLAIPFSTGEPPVFGALSFAATRNPITWSDSLLTQCRLIAQVISGALARKVAEENIHQRIKELELLYESGLAFSQLLNPKEIAHKILKLLGEKLNWHHTTIRLIRGQDELELLAFDQPGLEDQAKAQAVESHFKSSITRIGEGLSGWALQQSRIIRLGEVNNDPHYVATYPGLHSGLYVPLKSGNRAVGVISIESEQPNAFSEADEQLLSTLANQAANAFENARLYKETTRYAEELEQRVEERTADINLVNADLARAMRVKDEFLASMSHELRTPLTGILGLSEVLQLKMYGELNDKQYSTLKTIEESGRHLLDLINDILDLSKIDAGKFELQFTPCSLTDICQASLQLVKGMAQHRNQLVHYTPPAKPILVYADARRLKQMLVNLLSNAIKFSPENSEVGLEIHTHESERKLKLTVWDKGIGIKAEDLHKLFKPFIQLDSGLTREYSGTGLGLSLVQRLIELHNGGIEVESKFGEGSRFTIILPWSPQNTTPIPYAPPRNTGRLFNSALAKSFLVMIADDNEMILQMVADFLETKQYRVIKVRNGTELLERAIENHPDIMLVDIQMPGLGGLETIRRIRAHTDPQVASTPVIAITALAMSTDRENCLRAGANEYMSKPLRLKELDTVIQKQLERKQ